MWNTQGKENREAEEHMTKRCGDRAQKLDVESGNIWQPCPKPCTMERQRVATSGNHVRWKGREWQHLATKPKTMYDGKAESGNIWQPCPKPCTMERQRVATSGNQAQNHVRWKGREWQHLATKPKTMYDGKAESGNIWQPSPKPCTMERQRVATSGNQAQNHVRWKGREWQHLATKPKTMYDGKAEGGNIWQPCPKPCTMERQRVATSGNQAQNHVRWKGREWQHLATMPKTMYDGKAESGNIWQPCPKPCTMERQRVATSGNQAQNHVRWKGREWQHLATMPKTMYDGKADSGNIWQPCPKPCTMERHH